ncbi:uncharacterized protein V1477_000634 [Vespula maculifrons]|uniref:Uncharacterized protein n=1 Tax=Vespula maculifrons TaxID=7453 RepID=A0ABD2D289_VESMC
MRSGDTQLRETCAFDRLLQSLVQLCFGLRRGNLENFAEGIAASINEQLNCEVGIVSCERGQQIRACDRLLQILVQLCFGLRQGNLENFAEGIPASINEHLNCEVGIVSCERGEQRRAFDRLLQLLVQLCFGLRRWNIENFAEGIPANSNCEVGILGCERRKQRLAFDRLLQLLVQLCFGLRRGNLEIFADATRAGINEELIKIYNSLFDFRLKCEVGILSFERRQQSCAFDRLLQSLVQLCFGLRRGNLENFAEGIPASINEQLNCEVGIVVCERGQQIRACDRLLQILVQLCFGLRQGNLENFAEGIPASINEQLNCEVGIVVCERGQQIRACDRLLQILVQLCFGLRQGNLENFAEGIPASINEHLNCEVGIVSCERGEQRRAFDRLLQLLVQLCFGLRRWNIENFAEGIPANSNCEVGILGCERRKQRLAFDRLLQLLVQLCFGLRRGNLEIFADATRAGINEELIKIYNSLFDFRLKCEVGILSFERRQQSCAFDRLLQSLVQLCFGLRRGNLENFAEGIPASINEQLNCEVGIVVCERGQQIRACDRLLQILVQLCFGLRQGNLENFAEGIPASINEQLNCEVGIVVCERGQQIRACDRLLQILVQLCFGLRQGNLENFAEGIPASINEQLNCEVGIVVCERGQQIRACDRLLQILVQLCFGLRQGNLENFAEGIPASINEHLNCEVGIVSCERGEQRRAFDRLLQLLVQLCFGLRRWNIENFAEGIPANSNCEVGILGCERRKQRLAFDRLLQLLVQLCFGLRRGNLEIFADATRAGINEELIKIYNSLFDFRLKCEVGILSFERRQQSCAFDRLLQSLVQLCFGLRRGNLENFAEGIPASINEQLNCEVGIVVCERGQQIRACDRLLQILVQLCFGLRQGNLENFAEGIPASINEQLNCEVGIVVCERGQQIRACDRLLQILVQLCFGLRQGNLENFAEGIPASINEHLNCEVGIVSCERGEQRRAFDRLLQLLVQLCFGLRRWNIENFAEGIPANSNCEVGILGCERRKQRLAFDRLLQLLVQLCFGLRRGNLEIFADATRAGINEELIKIYNSLFDFRLKCEVGILSFERRQQSCAFDRLLQSLVQLCFGLRRGNLENFAEGIPASINEQLNCEVGIVVCERGQQIRACDRLLQILVQLCFGLRQGNLENFAEGIPASINEQLNCEVGIVVCERGQQIRACDRLLQILVQLCFGLRQGNLENFAEGIPASINEHLNCEVGIVSCERGEQRRAFDRLLQLLVQLCFGLRRWNIEDFAEGIPANSNCEVGILGCERRKQRLAFDRLLQLLVQLCFGLRRGNLEIFADATRAGINEELIKIYNSLFDFRLKCEVGILSFERRQQSCAFDRLLQSLVQLCFGLRRGNLENFAEGIPASINEQLNCKVGIVVCERGQQILACDRLLQILVQLCFGLRQGNLENFAESIPASINEHLNCEVGIVSCERGEQRRAFDRLLQLLVQLCFGLRRWNIEDFAEGIPANSNCEVGILGCERRKQRLAFDRLLQLLVQLCFGLRRGNLEIFADATRAGINEELIKIYNSLFDFRLKCEVGILSFERRQQSCAFDRLLQSLVQLCFGLRRGNLENFAEGIPASINEQLNCKVGIVVCERGQQILACDRLLQILVQLCFGLRQGNLENFAESIPASINEHLNCEVGIVSCERGEQRRAFDRLLQLLVQLCFGLRRWNIEDFAEGIPANSNCEVGILGCERRKQRLAFDRLLQLLVQLCFGLRRGNLEIFADATRAGINEELIKIYNSLFDFRLKCEVGILSFERRQQSCAFDRLLQSLVQLCFGLRRGNLENFAEGIPASINEQLNCKVGIVVCERGQQILACDRLLQILVQLCFGLRQGNLENFAESIPASINEHLNCEVGIVSCERGEQRRAFDRLLQLLVQLCFGLRRWNIEDFAEGIPANSNCEVGILGCERRKQRLAFDRLLQLLVQLCFGLRRGNLEIFADATRAGINEELIKIYNSLFDFRLKCEVGILSFERRQQSCAFDRLLQSLVQLCFGLRRGNLENFAEGIPASINEHLNCEVGIVSCERGEQRRAFDRLLQLLVQLCFGLRRWNLEIFADATRAGINEELIKIYNSLFDFRLKCEVRILSFERRQQSCAFDRLLQSLVQLCFGLRRGNIEIFAGCLSSEYSRRVYASTILYYSYFRNSIFSLLFQTDFAFSGDFDNLSPRMDLEIFIFPEDFENLFTKIFGLLEDFENLLPRRNLEIFAFPADFENLSPRVDLEIFGLPADFENLSPRVDLEIFSLSRDFENLSSRMDLEIFALSEDFENLFTKIFGLPEDFENLLPRRNLEIFAFPADFENLSPRVDLEIFGLPADFENLSPRVDLEIFSLSRDFENLSSRMDLEIFALSEDFENLFTKIFGLPEDFENLLPRRNLEIFAFPADFENLSPRVDLEIFGLPADFENLSPRVDLEIFSLSRDFENLSSRMDLEIFALSEDFENLFTKIFGLLEDFENLLPRRNLEIFAFPADFENLSPQVDLEIFGLPENFENLSPRRDLEIFAFPVDLDNLSPRMDLEIFTLPED